MKATLLLGGNMGNRLAYLEFAKFFIKRDVGEIIESSSIYETEAWGEKSTKAYLNVVLIIETNLEPLALLDACLLIEQKAGRKRLIKWGSRTLDIDLLFLDDLILESASLKVPHPEIAKRKFTLIPVNELIPNFIHPILQKKVSELLDICEDNLAVKPYESKRV